MRYYRIELVDPSGKKPTTIYTSYVNGRTDFGALRVELDLTVVSLATPAGSGHISVWGVSLQDIAQATNLNGFNINVYGGMQKGLPLANPAQAGLLVAGSVLQAFGNWQGLEQTLELIVAPRLGSPNAPKNLSFNWPSGTKLATALANTLSTAFPGVKQSINISPNLVLPSTETGFYSSLDQLAQYVKNLSASIVGGTYQGVEIVLQENQLVVYDGSTQTKPIQINFNDLIGQATWLSTAQIAFKCVMRADLHVSDYVKMPPGQITTTAQSYSQYRQGSVFQGTFQLDLVRHVGDSRQPDANSWVTHYEAHAIAG